MWAVGEFSVVLMAEFKSSTVIYNGPQSGTGSTKKRSSESNFKKMDGLPSYHG